MRPLIKKSACLIVICASFFAPLNFAAARVFNPHFIISDTEMRSSRAMSYGEIFEFLRSMGGFWNLYDVDPADGLLKSSSQLISDAAKRYEINPKFILVTIQKESSAIETLRPTKQQLDWAAGYGLCDGCFKQAALPQKYKGLAKQIDAAAAWMDWFMKNAGLAGLKQPGKTYVISRTKVTPINLATAALYNYTPHLHGNRLFWSIWNRWFGDGMVGFTYPDGTLVRNERTGAVVLVQNGKFRPIASRSVLASRFSKNAIVDVNEYDFKSFMEANNGRPVKFPDLSLVRTEDGTAYLLIGDTKREITSPKVFAKIGFNPEEVEDASADDLAEYADGEPIDETAAFPTGRLVQDSSTGAVFYAVSGVKHPVVDKIFMKTNFAGKKITPLKRPELESLRLGQPVKLPDGTLVKSFENPAVYVISGGKKRWIPTEDVFIAFSYDWKKILSVSAKVLEIHETGDPLLLVNDKLRAALVP